MLITTFYLIQHLTNIVIITKAPSRFTDSSTKCTKFGHDKSKIYRL